MKLILFRFVLLVVICYPICSRIHASEQRKVEGCFAPSNEERSYAINDMIALYLIDYYQSEINPNSISRCQFYLSCSDFTKYVINNYGMWGGLIRSIDRIQFREHKFSSFYYPLSVNFNGELKADDRYFAGNILEELPGPSNTYLRKENGAATQIEWAEYLFGTGQYSTAIEQYKEIIFFSEDEKIKSYCYFQLSRCLLGLGQYDQVASQIGTYLSQHSLTDQQESRAREVLGLSYSMQRLFPLAEAQFQTAYNKYQSGFSRIYLSWLLAEKGDWINAQKQFNESVDFNNLTDPNIKNLAHHFALKDKAIQVHWKNPLIAGTMSAILPGSGQLYCDHPIDAMQSFILVTGFGIATWMAYRYESSFHQPRVGTVIGSIFTLTYHTANIWGAQKTASFRNHRFREDILTPIRNSILNLEFSSPPP